MKKNCILTVILIISVFVCVSVRGADLPPSFALTSFTVSSINPMGTWKDAFSPSFHLGIDIQYPARILNLYLGGKVEYTLMSGKKYAETEFSMFNVNFMVHYQILDFQSGSLFVMAGTGVNFQQVSIDDASEDAVMGSFKLGASVKKQIAGDWLMSINSEYTYIPDTPYFTLGIGISYFFSKYEDRI